jgi:PAS domain-containing protein
MSLPLDLPSVSIPLQSLPVAAAALDRDGVIVERNLRFARLCGLTESIRPGQRLVDVVAESDRLAVEEALFGLTLFDDRLHEKCRISVLRAAPPVLWLTIDVARVVPDAVVAYLACLQALPGRRRIDSPPNARHRGDRAISAWRSSRPQDRSGSRHGGTRKEIG